MPDRLPPDELLARHGTTYATQAGITLRDTPAPLFQLLVLTMLASNRISADVAAATARELFRCGWRTPQRLRASTRQQRVAALGRGGYRRYDESTADYLAQLTDRVLDQHGGDLRRLRPDQGGTVGDLERGLRGYPRIGPVGAGIFRREVQTVWPELAPYFDRRALSAADDLGYPTDPVRLAALAPADRTAELAAALVRWSLSR